MNVLQRGWQWLRGRNSTPPEPQAVSRDHEVLRAAYQQLRATYDAARNGDEFKNIWANADRYDADSAHSKAVRHTLIANSRYEINNNGYSDGMAQTYAGDLVGSAPVLRMQTGSSGFNRLVETEWYYWCKAVHFRRKLLCMAHAKHCDGEAFAILRRNPRVKHTIQVDLILREAEQCQTPMLPISDRGYIDGIKFDEFGNPLWYDFTRDHPGSSNGLMLDLEPEHVPAHSVLHWYKMRRPGQHRAVPEMASTLNSGAASRRWREATLAAAETAADFSLVMKTQMTPDEAQAVAPFSTMDINKRMMAFAPAGWDPFQLKSEFPTATHAEFSKSLINEQARPKSMPLNKAMCDSSNYNYASGRLDHQTYYQALDVEREDCNDLVLDRLFDVWFDLAVLKFGWLGGNPEAITASARAHGWDWPKHQVADVQSEASANDVNLKNGSLSLNRLYSLSGLDFEDELPGMAESIGVSVDEMRVLLRNVLFNSGNQQASMMSAQTAEQQAQAAIIKDLQSANGNLSVLELTLALQKIYLAVGKVISAEEAREILNRSGANLSEELPEGLLNVPAPSGFGASLNEGDALYG